MKLSRLEQLVAAMRDKANRMNVDDPEVQFYEDNKQELREALDANVFCNMDIVLVGDMSETMRNYVVPVSGDAAQRGDFCLPLKPV